MSAALGNAGLLIALVRAGGALATSVAIIGENRRALVRLRICRNHCRRLCASGGGDAVGAVLSDYSIDFVQRVGSSTTPALYNVAAMWERRGFDFARDRSCALHRGCPGFAAEMTGCRLGSGRHVRRHDVLRPGEFWACINIRARCDGTGRF